MPGITGIIGKAGVEQADVERMTRCMLHEPSYVSGTYANQDLGLCVGWVSHAGSFSDCMPLWNERRDVCLIFSGEDFMRAEEIRQCGAPARDSEVGSARHLMALYEAMGLQFIEKLNGWFSGLLIDLRRKLAVLFNDRYGLARVYHHQTADRFYFSSEAKSLLEVLPDLRRLDLRGVAETFSCGCVMQDRTLFAGISLLPGASRWSFSNGHIVKERYFSPQAWEQQPALGNAEFYDRLKETFAGLVPKYVRGANSVAMSLTGGLDGRMIMAWANPPPGTLPCYSFGGPYRAPADVKIARRIATLCGQTHRTITIGGDFFGKFPDLAAKAVLVSDGTMDVTGAVELYANRAARQIAPVRLTGNYGSEIVRGNVAFRPGKVTEALLEPEFAQSVRAAAATYQAERDGHHPLSFIAFKQVPWHHYSRLAVEQSQLTLRSPYLDNDLVELMYRAPPELFSSQEPSLRLVHDGNPYLAELPTDRGVVYRDAPVLGMLRKLHAEFGVRAEYAYDYGMPQRLAGLDHLLAPLHLERMFLGRHKFYHFRVWYRDQLAPYLKEILLDSRARQRGYLQAKVLESMVDAHTSGRQNWTREIHRALTLELLQRQLIDRR